MKWMFAPALALVVVAPSAAPAGFTNGSFETFTNSANPGVASQLGNSGTGGYSSLAGWTIGSGTYGFLMASGAADTTGSYSPQFNSTFRLWGSNDGGVATLPASSPDRGNYLALDGASGYRGTGISQTITGLTVGQQYLVTFDWASGQQYNFNGATNESLQVSLGNQTQTTATVQNVSHGFTDWVEQSFVFTADATSSTLNFLAMSTSGGLPPIVLLDGVTFNAVPEPASLALVGLGLGVATLTHRLRRKAPAA